MGPSAHKGSLTAGDRNAAAASDRRLRKCVVCGAALVHVHFNSKTCSPEHAAERRRQQHQKFHNDNRERQLRYYREYYIANRAVALESGRKYRAANRDKMREYFRKYQIENRDAIREARRKYYADNRDLIREYRILNREKIRETQRKYTRSDAYRKRRAVHSAFLTAVKQLGLIQPGDMR